MRRLLTLVALTSAILAHAEDFRTRVHVQQQAAAKEASNANVVVWLTPIGAPAKTEPMQHIRLVQKNKRFYPHLLVITTGTNVEFPNQDPFFHNVFSLYKGKRFDLGLYEAGSSRSIRFERPGVSFVFCNIHPEMSASVIVLQTPYFATSTADGDILIKDVPPGRYRFEVWFERSSPEALAQLAHEISLPSQKDLPAFTVPEITPADAPHKNKYGQDYDKSKPYGPE